MKAKLIGALALTAFAAQAETITLEPAACGAGVWCASVPNDAGDSVLLYGSTNYRDVGVIVGEGGVFSDYASPNYTANYVGTCPVSPAAGTMQLTSIPMQGYNGTAGTATITATFSCTSVRGGSGRGQSYHQIWTLLEGTVTR